jgi:hypothetical protein
MKDLRRFYSLDNLVKSWKWLNTSAKYDYKSYYRGLYKAYALSSNENLKDLRERIKNETYVASHSVKIYLPKKSGVLRPFTLLSIEDQIVYQALVNIIADKILPKVKPNYNNINFGNRYAGPNSTYFFKEWKIGYKLFNSALIESYKCGLTTTATFDLTAFYDSIDHKVLGFMLSMHGFGDDFIKFLLRCLERWTCNTGQGLYHGHGIPQGPMASGLLAEVIMHYVDEEFKKPKYPVKYLRYVDDIRLMAVDERGVRQGLLKLDLLSKRVGLFPQPSKIDIHEITDISGEIKSVSQDPEIREIEKSLSSEKVLEKLKVLSKGNLITNETQFKYLLNIATPSTQLNNKLLLVLEKQQHLYESILRYFECIPKLSKKVSKELVKQIKINNLYEETTAKYLRCCHNRIHSDYYVDILDICLNYSRDIDTVKSPTLKSIILTWLLCDLKLTYNDLEKLLTNSVSWTIQSIIGEIKEEHYGTASYQSLINEFLTHEDSDVALSAAYLCINNDLKITVKKKDINAIAQLPLSKLGKIKAPISRKSTIGDSLEIIFKKKFDECNWKNFLNNMHSKCESQLFMCRSYVQTDASAYFNQLDVFNDLLLDNLYKKEPHLGIYTLGRIGSVLLSVKLSASYPKFFNLCKTVHELRLKSELSHPVEKSTRKYTRRIRFIEIKKHKRIMIEGYQELINSINAKTLAVV